MHEPLHHAFYDDIRPDHLVRTYAWYVYVILYHIRKQLIRAWSALVDPAHIMITIYRQPFEIILEFADYVSQAFDLVKDQHDWGRITCKKLPDGRTRLYLHVFNWPLSKKLPVTGIKGKPLRVYLLADKQKSPIPFSGSKSFTLLELPEKQPDPYVSVVVLEYDF